MHSTWHGNRDLGTGGGAQGSHTDRRLGLASALRERTRTIHAQAERAGIMREILRGRASRFAYALFLGTLLPAYQELERGLVRHRDTPGVRAILHPGLFRSRAIETDLEGLAGSTWRRTLTRLPEGDDYARRIARAAEADPATLIAHAYVRYLGDLNGGQVLRERLVQSLRLDPRTLAFYEFPDIGDVAAFRAAYRDALDRAGGEIAQTAPVIEEAVAAFRLNIALSEAVLSAVGRQAASAAVTPASPQRPRTSHSG